MNNNNNRKSQGDTLPKIMDAEGQNVFVESAAVSRKAVDKASGGKVLTWMGESGGSWNDGCVGCGSFVFVLSVFPLCTCLDRSILCVVA
jgi:hypothetical protein